MKLTAFAAIAASAALVSAIPLRVVVVTLSDAQELKPLSLRFGLPAAGATVARPMDKPVAHPAHARPCGGRFRQKSIEFSNALRKAFGFPTIEDHQGFPTASVASVKLNGVTTFIEGPEIMYAGKPGWRGKTKGGDRVHIVEWTPESRPPPPFPPHRGGPPPPPFPPHHHGIPPPPPPHHGHHHHHPHSHHGPPGEPFLGRVQNALLSLGPWEGRVVAFVLGCGIGVLLRMIWVLGLIMVRSFRGTNETHHYVLVVEDDEDNSRATPVSAPPAYVYPVDEKVATEETDAKKAQPTDN